MKYDKKKAPYRKKFCGMALKRCEIIKFFVNLHKVLEKWNIFRLVFAGYM